MIKSSRSDTTPITFSLLPITWACCKRILQQALLYCCLSAKSCKEVVGAVALDHAGGGEEDDLVYSVVIHELAEGHMEIAAVIQSINSMVILGEIGDKGVAETALYYHAAGVILNVVVHDGGQRMVAGQEHHILGAAGGVAHIGEHGPGEGIVIRLRYHGLKVAGGIIGVHIVRLQAAGLVAAPVKTAQKFALVPFLEVGKQGGGHAEGLADGLIGVVSAQCGPVMVGAEIDILVIVAAQIAQHIHGGYIFAHGGVHIIDDLAVVGAVELFQIVRLHHYAHAGGDEGGDDLHILFRHAVGKGADGVHIKVAPILAEAKVGEGEVFDLNNGAKDDIRAVAGGKDYLRRCGNLKIGKNSANALRKNAI